MLNFAGLIEIGQDGAGIIETGEFDTKGFFTAGVESCVVTVYVCKRATILIHDSSQIKLLHITSLIKKYGTVRKLIVAHGKQVDGKHIARLEEIIRVAGVGKNQLKNASVPLDSFVFLCNASGEYQAIPNVIPNNVPRIPEKAKRQSICEVNNFFLEPNAQSLRLDIQYKEGAYLEVQTLDKSLDDLLKIIKRQPEFFFQNVAVLSEAHKQGVLILPENLRELAEKYNLGRLRFEQPGSQDRIDEAREFLRYMDAMSQQVNSDVSTDNGIVCAGSQVPIEIGNQNTNRILKDFSIRG